MNYFYYKRLLVDWLIIICVIVGIIIMSTPGIMLISHWLLPEYDYIWYKLIEFIW